MVFLDPSIPLNNMPLFETQQGKCVPLTSYKNVCHLQLKISEESFKNLCEVDEKTICLTASQLNCRLSKHLGRDVINDL